MKGNVIRGVNILSDLLINLYERSSIDTDVRFDSEGFKIDLFDFDSGKLITTARGVDESRVIMDMVNKLASDKKEELLK